MRAWLSEVLYARFNDVPTSPGSRITPECARCPGSALPTSGSRIPGTVRSALHFGDVERVSGVRWLSDVAGDALVRSMPRQSPPRNDSKAPLLRHGAEVTTRGRRRTTGRGSRDPYSLGLRESSQHRQRWPPVTARILSGAVTRQLTLATRRAAPEATDQVHSPSLDGGGVPCRGHGTARSRTPNRSRGPLRYDGVSADFAAP